MGYSYLNSALSWSSIISAVRGLNHFIITLILRWREILITKKTKADDLVKGWAYLNIKRLCVASLIIYLITYSLPVV